MEFSQLIPAVVIRYAGNSPPSPMTSLCTYPNLTNSDNLELIDLDFRPVAVCNSGILNLSSSVLPNSFAIREATSCKATVCLSESFLTSTPFNIEIIRGPSGVILMMSEYD